MKRVILSLFVSASIMMLPFSVFASGKSDSNVVDKTVKETVEKTEKTVKNTEKSVKEAGKEFGESVVDAGKEIGSVASDTGKKVGKTAFFGNVTKLFIPSPPHIFQYHYTRAIIHCQCSFPKANVVFLTNFVHVAEIAYYLDFKAVIMVL